MLLNIVVLVLVLGVTFMHSIFGLFSGIINVFCCVIATAVALGFYEALNQLATDSFQLHSAYVEPICLISLFVITLIVLRSLTDAYLRGNVRIPMQIDWAGGAFCGLIIGQLCIGMLVIGLLMLPIGGNVLGFSRYERVEELRDPDHQQLALFERRSLWIRPDEFTIGLFNLVSGSSMRGTTTLASVYPDFTDAVFFTTNTVQVESSPSPLRTKKSGDGFKDGLTVNEWWVETGELAVRYRKEVPTVNRKKPDFSPIQFKAAPGKILIGVRMVLRGAAADMQKNRRMHLFRPTMLRLVGTVGERPEQAVARVLNTGDKNLNGANRLVDYDNNFSLESGDQTIDAYFEVNDRFRPRFVEYRRHARAAVGAANLREAAPEIALAVRESPEQQRSNRGRRQRFAQSGTGDNDKLPFEVALASIRRQSGVKITDGKLVKGRFFGRKSKFEAKAGDTPVKEFALPAGKRLLQVRYNPQKALTIAGGVFNFVNQLSQYTAMDSNGNRYRMAGYYGIVKRGGNDYVELFFNGDPSDPLDPSYRLMLDFKQIKEKEINQQDDAIVGLLFLVTPGVKIVRVEDQAGKGTNVAATMRK